MSNQHPGLPVHGYAPTQSEGNVALVNRIKEAEERFLRLIDELAAAGPAHDQRWVALARTNMQMAATCAARSVFQPQRISLPEDNA